MAKLYISEYSSVAFGVSGVSSIPIADEGRLVADQTPVTFSTEAKSAAFNAKTRFVRIWSDADCCIKIAASPTATTSNKPLAAKSPEYFGVKPGDKISVIAL